VFHSGSLPVLPTNFRLGWKSMQVANTLAYYDTAIITAVKSFIVLAPGHVCKSLAFLALCTVETSPAARLFFWQQDGVKVLSSTHNFTVRGSIPSKENNKILTLSMEQQVFCIFIYNRGHH
jgi:hypothetical protein